MEGLSLSLLLSACTVRGLAHVLYVHRGPGQCFQNPDICKPELVGEQWLVGLAGTGRMPLISIHRAHLLPLWHKQGRWEHNSARPYCFGKVMYVIGFLFRDTHGIGCINSLSFSKYREMCCFLVLCIRTAAVNPSLWCSSFSQKYETVHNDIL